MRRSDGGGQERRFQVSGTADRIGVGFILVCLLCPMPLQAQGDDGGLWAEVDGRLMPLPVVRTEIYADVAGFVTSVQVTQIYDNPYEHVIEARYVFPLPERAAVDGFLMEIGDRQIRGEIRRRGEAKAIYQEARSEGRTAALMEQHRPNVFSQSVANILPGEAIVVHLNYVDRLPYSAGSYRLRFPTTVASRYEGETPLPQAGAAAGEGASWPQAMTESVLPDLFLDVVIDTAVPLRDVTSPTHDIVVQRENEPSMARVFLADHDRAPDRDILLEIEVAGEAPEVGVLAHRSGDDGFFTLLVQPKAEIAAEEATPREILFILDESGSMSGLPLDMCRHFLQLALERLGPRDRFNLIRFSSEAKALAHAPLQNTPQNVRRALKVLEKTHGGGGTELAQGLSKALAQPRQADYLRVLFFLTDGQIGGEEELLRMVRAQEGQLRIFTLGVGRSVNHYLLREMAALGRGTYENISPDGDAARAVEQFQTTINRPYLTDIEIDWGTLPVEELQPSPLPDLYSGQNLTLVGRYRWGAEGDVRVRGRIAGEPWEKSIHISLPEEETGFSAVASIWARQRIRHLLVARGNEAGPQIEAEVTELALRHRLLSPYTSFVAVDTYVATAGTSRDAALMGRVVDRHGNGTPGVMVLVVGSGGELGTTTDHDGNYRVPGVPPGNDYRAIAELPGYARVEISPIRLAPGLTTRQDFTLVPSTETTEKITVTGKGDIVDIASTKTATVFNSEIIEGLPILGRSYQDILTLAPGVSDVDGDGNPNVNGSRSTDFQTRVDGANTTDPVTGTFGQNLNLESIAEIEIITTGANAEFSQAQGGFANIITKSGGNDFEGSFKFFFRSDLFDNDGANNNDITDENLFAGLNGFTDIRPFLTLGGPIVRDRLWYFVSLEYISQESPINTGTFPVLQTQDGWNNFLKFTWQINPSNRFSIQMQNDPRRFTGFGLGTGVAPESDFIFDQGGNVLTARWSYNISPSVLLEALVSDFDTGIDVLPLTDPEPCIIDEITGRCNPFAEDLYTFDVNAGTTFGPYFLTSRDTRTRDTIKADLSIFMDSNSGSHNIKTGFEFAREGFENTVTNSRVRSDDFERSGTGGLGSGSGDQFSGLISFFDSVPSTQQVEADKDNFGFYVQDSWKPRPNLTVNLGMRFDREDATTTGYESFDPVAQGAEFLELYKIGRGTDVDPNTGEEWTFQDAFADATLIYDINGDGLDSLHCTIYDIDGDEFGDGMPDGVPDDFLTCYDGDFDGTCSRDNPFDTLSMIPDGVADGTSQNPLCDRQSTDTFDLISVFSRHQFDETGDPFSGLGVIDPDAGPPGQQRTIEEFNITNNNFAPRFSISWDPWANNKTKIFATWSRFYDKLFLNTLTPELGPDTRSLIYDANEQLNGSSAVVTQTGRFTIRQVDRDMKTPFTDEITIGFERELAPEWSFSFTYVNRIGRDQLQDIDFNHFTQDANGDGILDDNFGRGGSASGDPDPDGDGTNIGGGGVANVPDGQPDLFTFNPFFNQVLRVGNFNSSTFESYQFTIVRRLSRQWQMNANYVYSKAYGDAEGFTQGLGNDPGTVESEFGPLSFDQTHVVKVNATSFLPGNQSLGGTVQWASGTPFSLIFRRASADSFGSVTNQRVTYPTGQRNDQRNEGSWLINLSYKKNFVFGKVNSSVGIEVQNLLNNDDLTIFQVDQTQFQGVTGVRAFGRRWQLSAEFHF